MYVQNQMLFLESNEKFHCMIRSKGKKIITSSDVDDLF